MKSAAAGDVRRSLSDAEPRVFWTDRTGAPDPSEPLSGVATADLVVVGGGFTGLWTALLAKQRDPSRDVVLLEAESVGFGASGRNGGFLSASLTHGLAHGVHVWPDEIDILQQMGRDNLAAIAAFVTDHAIDAHLQLVGKSVFAVRRHQVEHLRSSAAQHLQHGEDATFLDRDAARVDVRSPTYLAGLRVRSGGGLVDPASLCWGLLRVARESGVRVHEGTHVTGLERDAGAARVVTRHGRVTAARVVLATNAFPTPARRLRPWILPVYDHVLVTEPLTPAQVDSLGWSENQGLTDAGNQFHYYRRTRDDRILWGGYDAVYHFGNRVDARLEQREASHRLLASQFFDTFPQLQGVRFTHRWAGVIDTTSRFTPMFGTLAGGRVGYALGFTGLGVGSSRFAAETVLDLVDGLRTERTTLGMVRRRPVPFPPEPFRYAAVQTTRWALAREDRTGRRNSWLRLLDRAGVGFDS